VIWSRKEFKKCKTLRNYTVHFLFMTRNAKVAVERTFEPCEKGTNYPAVQRSLRIWSNVSSLSMPTFKISKCKKALFINKASIRR